MTLLQDYYTTTTYRIMTLILRDTVWSEYQGIYILYSSSEMDQEGVYVKKFDKQSGQETIRYDWRNFI